MYRFAICLLSLIGSTHIIAQTPLETLPVEISKNETQKEETIETFHSIKIGGVDIPYKATVGTQILSNEKGEPKASLFYIAYTRENAGDLHQRPIMFCFNGGPGSSSVWLHMGMIGPKRVELNEEGTEAILPYNFKDNPYSYLDLADLVFIDPVSTGYSRAISSEDSKQFHAVDSDIQSLAEFIRLYTTRNLRWVSPKYLAGESYGTLRAAGLAWELHNTHHLELNGIILISSVLSYQTIAFDDGNDLPYVMFLPSYTAAAFYHHRLSPELQKDLLSTLSEVEAFTLGEYAQALMKGDTLPSMQRQAIIQKLARYTALSPKYIDRANLRVNIYRFAKELLANERRGIGRFDSRVKSIVTDPSSDGFEFDPGLENILGPFTATFNQYIRANLNWKMDAEYKILANVSPWDFGQAKNQYLDMSAKLSAVMSQNLNFKVFVASGFNDLAIPFFSTTYTFSHLGLDPSLQPHITLKNYPGGHLMYLNYPTLIQMKQDISNFVKNNRD